MRRSICLLTVLLAVGGCGHKPVSTAKTRPDWRGAEIEGIAPLMTPQAVEAALNARGYKQVRCLPEKNLYPDPLNHGGDIPCYGSPTSPMRIHLYFLELNEGRRLAVASFSGDLSMDRPEAERIAVSQAYAQRLSARFGRPSTVSKNPHFSIVYWNRPGGQHSLPDTISTKIDAYSAANVDLTSMWAYREERPSK